jgi:hypothetical protein
MVEFKPLTLELSSAHRALVEAMRAILRADPATLSELRKRVAGEPSTSKLSQLCGGTGAFPTEHEVAALVRACAPGQVREVVRLLHVAEAERTLRAASPIPELDSVAYTTTVDQLGSQQDWSRLGVHRPISRLRSGIDMSRRIRAGGLPTYVPRATDLDSDPETGLRAGLAEAAAGAGPAVVWVVIRGESAAGKTRAALEAMRAELPSWRLLIPHGVRELGALLDTGPKLAYTVVWFDEIDQTLSHPDGVAQLRRLLALEQGPVVLLGTLRTDRESALRGTAAGKLLSSHARRITLKRRPLGAELAAEQARLRGRLIWRVSCNRSGRQRG